MKKRVALPSDVSSGRQQYARRSVSSKRPSASDVPQNARSIPFNRKTH